MRWVGPRGHKSPETASPAREVQSGGGQSPRMEVTVSIPGEETQDIAIEEGTYGDLLKAVGYSPQEASVLVDGAPVPEDAPVTSSSVTILRLIAGG